MAIKVIQFYKSLVQFGNMLRTYARSPVPSEVRSPLSGRLVLKERPKRDLDSSNELCGMTPKAFKVVREQMALSLERTRQLEQQIKQIPGLKNQISNLKAEKERMLQTIEILKQKQNQPAVNKNTPTSIPLTGKRNRSSSLSCAGEQYKNGFNSPSTKEIGVACSVLTRNIGVGNQIPSRKDVSAATGLDSIGYADKWFGEKLKFINDQKENVKRQSLTKIPMISKANQTLSSSSYSQGTQTPTAQAKTTTSRCIQTAPKVVATKDQETIVKPVTLHFGMQKSVESYNIGVSDDTVTDVNCDKCNVVKMGVAVGPDGKEDQHVAPVSLASLNFPRSKSFNLGDDKSSSKRQRSISVQYQYKHPSSSKASQYESSNVSGACQTSIGTHSRGLQYESTLMDSSTQFEETFVVFSTPKKHKSTETSDCTKENKSIGCNTSLEWLAACSECQKLRNEKDTGEKEAVKTENVRTEDRRKDELKKSETPVVSRIPKPQLTPTSGRKILKRQDTYKKLNPSFQHEDNEVELSGLDLTKSPTTSITTFERVREKLKLPEVSRDITNNGASHQAATNSCNLEPEPVQSSTSHISKHRKKAMPSKEMQGAMKVLNDSLQKQTQLPKSHSAIDIIQQEWFKMSGVVTANPLDVEDYLDAFEDMSSMLLDYIVNMTDASGNTAMHYAVSHGNFDVVSILLDSKVCDINKPNKAGYTSVMLVSLADIPSSTHANVVRRLLQMGDVNKRAKEYGQTALMLAGSNGKLDMVKMLLEAGADINIQDDDGSTALMCAAEHGHIEIVKHLLSQPDCDSTITDVDGSTALKIAMEAEHRPIGVLLYAHERNLMVSHGHKYKKKSSSPKSPSSPLSTRHSHSALNNTRSSK